MNSDELHSEIGRWPVPKTPWMEGSAIYVRIGTSRMKTTSS